MKLSMSLMLLVVVVLCGWEVTQGELRQPVVFGSEESACFAQKKVLYPATGKCYDLKTKGPCPKDHWLVFDLEEAVNGTGSLRPVCKPCPCCDRPLSVYWPDDQRCRKTNEALCPLPGTKARSDIFGEGECACKTDPPHLRYEGDMRDNVTLYDSGTCYQLYTKGPCRRRNVLVAHLLDGVGWVARCQPDPCFSSNERRPTPGGYAKYAPDDKCYPLNTQGPCAATLIFKIYDAIWQPACLSDTNTVFAPPTECDGGDCPAPLTVPTEDQEAYAWELLVNTEKKKRRKKDTREDERKEGGEGSGVV